jgi:hypothetical protein
VARRGRCTTEAVLSGRTQLHPGVGPTENRTTAEGAHILHWSGDRVSEAWHLGDWLGWLTRPMYYCPGWGRAPEDHRGPATGQGGSPRADDLVRCPAREDPRPRGDAAGASPPVREEGDMYARSTTIRANPGSLDDAIAYMRDEVWPAMRRPASENAPRRQRPAQHPTGAIAAVPRWRDPRSGPAGVLRHLRRSERVLQFTTGDT